MPSLGGKNKFFLPIALSCCRKNRSLWWNCADFRPQLSPIPGASPSTTTPSHSKRRAGCHGSYGADWCGGGQRAPRLKCRRKFQWLGLGADVDHLACIDHFDHHVLLGYLGHFV